MSDIQYIEGLRIKEPVTKEGKPLPDFIKAKGSINRLDMMAWLAQQEEDWINFDVKVSKKGNWYCAVDDWKPTEDPGNSVPPKEPNKDLDVPF